MEVGFILLRIDVLMVIVEIKIIFINYIKFAF